MDNNRRLSRKESFLFGGNMNNTNLSGNLSFGLQTQNDIIATTEALTAQASASLIHKSKSQINNLKISKSQMLNVNSFESKVKKRDINLMPEKVMIKIFSFLTIKHIQKCALVCKSWRNLTQNGKLWRVLRLRPDYTDSIHIKNNEYFMHLMSHRFSQALEYIELPIELITAPVLHELANKCNYLNHLTLDFASAMQLQDFNDLSVFPCNLKTLQICLSEVIFLEGFMRKIYSSLSSVENLHLIGTHESSNDPDEAYETINITKIKQHTPNLKLINFFGVTFIDDNHLESLASSCIHLESVALNYCARFKGYSLKTLVNRCKKLKTLLLQNTSLEDKAISSIDWSQSQVRELDLTSTDLSEDTMLSMLCNLPKITHLQVGNCDGFTDKILEKLDELGKLDKLQVLDLSNTVNLSVEAVFNFIKKYGHQLKGFAYTGNPKVTEQFWINSIPNLSKIRVLILGTPFGWFKKLSSRIHIDQIMECFAVFCPLLERLEIQWDADTIRFNENSRKFIDHIRLRCSRLKTLVLSDGEYYEMVKSNFERADRFKVVRTTTSYITNCVCLLSNYNQFLFN